MRRLTKIFITFIALFAITSAYAFTKEVAVNRVERLASVQLPPNKGVVVTGRGQIVIDPQWGTLRPTVVVSIDFADGTHFGKALTPGDVQNGHIINDNYLTLDFDKPTTVVKFNLVQVPMKLSGQSGFKVVTK